MKKIYDEKPFFSFKIQGKIIVKKKLKTLFKYHWQIIQLKMEREGLFHDPQVDSNPTCKL
tara:strand:- start:1534 stop:1713 length:180 start_codon:yes stop_codon:yes gene_type:complete